jgi:hypothetical protein
MFRTKQNVIGKVDKVLFLGQRVHITLKCGHNRELSLQSYRQSNCQKNGLLCVQCSDVRYKEDRIVEEFCNGHEQRRSQARS